MLAAALLLVAIGAQVMFWAYGQIGYAAERRQHTHEIIIHAQDWLSELKDAQTGQRGYALTGDESFLEPYLKVLDGLDDSLKQLRQRTLIPEAHARRQSTGGRDLTKTNPMDTPTTKRLTANNLEGLSAYLTDGPATGFQLAHEIDSEAALKTSEKSASDEQAESLILELRGIVRKIFCANEAERTKMNHVLQQEIAQALLGIKIKLQALKGEVSAKQLSLSQEIKTAHWLVETSEQTLSKLIRKFSSHHA